MSEGLGGVRFQFGSEVYRLGVVVGESRLLQSPRECNGEGLFLIVEAPSTDLLRMLCV